MTRKRTWLLALATTVVGFGAVTASAQAAFDLTASGGPTNLAAAAHSDLKVNLTFTDDTEDLKNLTLHLPPGLLGNPNAVTPCTQTEFSSAAGCPAGAQVGAVSSTAVALGIPLDVPGKIYVLTPQGGEPARLGIRLSPSDNPLLSLLSGLAAMPPIDLQAPISLRAPGDYGLDTTLTDIPRTVTAKIFNTIPLTLAIFLKSMSMTLYGTPPAGHGPFLVNPTSCASAPITVDAAPWSAPTAFRSTSIAYTPTGCDQVPFTPSLDATPKQQPADQPTELGVTVGMPGGDTGGLAQSHVKTATIVLPEGTALSPGVGTQGLAACTVAQLAPDRAGAPSCPAESKIGTVAFVTPLLGQLSGDAYLGEPTADTPLRLFVYAAKGDVTVKLVGRVLPDPQTGQITTIFTNLPPVPFTAFTLTFRGGPNAVLKAPRDCGTHTATSTLEPFTRPGTAAHPTAAFTTVDCPSARFSPQLGVDVSPTQATADTAMTMTIARSDADGLLDAMNVSLPPGLLGYLAAVPPCAVDAARAGNCPADSQVGTVTAAAGTGPAPASLTGPIYLTGPVDGGIAGMAIVVPAKVGPIDLGNVVVLSALKIRPDIGIDVSASGLPRIVGGVPLAIRSMQLALNRPGFLFNASSCAAQQIGAQFTAQDGATASASTTYQPTGCANVPFGPKLTAKIGGSTTKPSLQTTIVGFPGQSTIAGAQLTLPVQLGADLGALAKTCPQAQYAAGQCPAASTVGSATAISPLIPIPLTGPVRLVKVEGRVLPSLAIDLSGVLNIHLQADTDSAGGRLRSTVHGIPDVPLSTFTLDLASGGLLKSDRGTLCTGTPKVDATFTGYNGATTTTSATAANGPCASAASTSALRVSARLRGTRRGGTPTLTIKVRGKDLRSLRVSLPRQLRLNYKRLYRGTRIFQGGRARARRIPAHTRSVVTAHSSRKTGSIWLRLGNGALRRGTGLRTGRRVTLKLRVGDGKAHHVTVRVLARR